MKVIDPGHTYELMSLDGGGPQTLRFVKRCDLEKPWRFPGNKNAYPGTTLQNVIRACLERFRYLQRQIWCPENAVCIASLKLSLWLLEFRAARRHGRAYFHSVRFAENAKMCAHCGHTACDHSTGELPRQQPEGSTPSLPATLCAICGKPEDAHIGVAQSCNKGWGVGPVFQSQEQKHEKGAGV